jgi:hypothetical protein
VFLNVNSTAVHQRLSLTFCGPHNIHSIQLLCYFLVSLMPLFVINWTYLVVFRCNGSLYGQKKLVQELEFQPKWEKFGGPPKNSCGPPVEKHCFLYQWYTLFLNLILQLKIVNTATMGTPHVDNLVHSSLESDFGVGYAFEWTFCAIQVSLDQWFSTFFSLRHTIFEKNCGTPKSKKRAKWWKYDCFWVLF